jgi:sugar phosphate isomerase/epimerase
MGGIERRIEALERLYGVSPSSEEAEEAERARRQARLDIIRRLDRVANEYEAEHAVDPPLTPEEEKEATREALRELREVIRRRGKDNDRNPPTGWRHRAFSALSAKSRLAKHAGKDSGRLR